MTADDGSADVAGMQQTGSRNAPRWGLHPLGRMKPVTPAPVSVTTPANSWLATEGERLIHWPVMKLCRSEPQILRRIKPGRFHCATFLRDSFYGFPTRHGEKLWSGQTGVLIRPGLPRFRAVPV